MLSIHYDCDGVLRDFHTQAYKIFFRNHPEYKKYILPVGQIRGWSFKDQLKPNLHLEYIDELFWEELFNHPTYSYEVFEHAKPLVSRKEWYNHLKKINDLFGKVNITISTHQTTHFTKDATIKWLSKNGFLDGDKINVLFAKNKEDFGANYLLDDKPSMIERMNGSPGKGVGVLRLNKYSNGWYVRKHLNNIKIPHAINLEDFYEIIKKGESA